MKQAEDHKTIDLLEGGKRGRGRPRRGDALSDAQRAQRYRENKKAQPAAITAAIKRDGVTENRPASSSSGLPSYGMLECRIILLNADNLRLSDELQDALDQIAALKTALANAEYELNVTRHGKSPSKKSASR